MSQHHLGQMKEYKTNSLSEKKRAALQNVDSFLDLNPNCPDSWLDLIDFVSCDKVKVTL